MRVHGVLLALAHLACAAPVPLIEASVVSAVSLDYGRFEVIDGVPQHVETTDQIPCALGNVFGVLYRVSFPEGSEGELPVVIRWRHPEIDAPQIGVRGTVSASPPLPLVERGTIHLENAGLWGFTDAAELVEGRYEFFIELRDGSQVLLERGFDINGCEWSGGAF